ncbi:type 1 glutamine amidotransferase domain-containing protein [Bowmanella sp. Y26]|uniref:type 1 glutamine amidotransferase domain-containing protein n=1 Tax=Bowmanella yangjiangensis TaxID=2811230 RepID=UPI001BDC4255|nr:type 1 glutamine amidotransferase domain-containing protein [Bowmanella yangjiangensis]MBT1063674.1 type 1 glutamine amidotransferase domain-containing protein [Bowmanella yangjiangensis]
MKPIHFALMILGLLLSSGLYAKPRVLMVVSSHGEINAADEIIQPGFEFDELAKVYLVFTSHGLDVDIASPAGGQPVADKYDPGKAYNQSFLADPKAKTLLTHSLKLAELDAQDYQAVFIVGGKGPMFDLWQDSSLQGLIRDIWENNGVVSAVCHGPAALVDVKLSDGSYLVAGRKVNGFTNQEEAAFGKKWKKDFAFLLEDKLKERGASFERSALMLSHVSEDDRLITGQNPFSTVDTALAVVTKLGLDIKVAPNYTDDNSIRLVHEILQGKLYSTEQLAQNTQVQVELIGMYGYYLALFGEQENDKHNAIRIMELVGPIMQHPVLVMQLAKEYQALGKHQAARDSLQAFLQSHPDATKVQELLDQLTSKPVVR